MQFTDTDKRAGIYNGNAGTITAIDEQTGRLRAVLDTPAAGKGREVAWSAAAFAGFRHGYAGTIYKGQGKTLDHSYLYHTHHWRAAASYVALTRQRDSAQVFVARETARDARELARQMARGEVKAASIAWATREEMAERQVVLEPREGAGTRSHGVGGQSRGQGAWHAQQRAKEYWGNVAAAGRFAAPDPLTAKVRAASEVRQQQAELPMPGWLIPPYVSRDGRDSLGRGLDPADIAAAVAADARVQQAKSEPWRHLERAYRDPHAAHARLDELARAEGWTEAAARIDTTHEQLGPLRGRDGMFASPSAQMDRAYAIIAARSLGDSLRRIGEAERRAERQYREDVTAQLQRDAVGVPKLSAAAAAVLEAVHAARTEPPGKSWYVADTRDRPPWRGPGKRDSAIPRSRRRSTGSRKPPSNDWVRRGLSPFCAVRHEGRPALPGVEPGQRQALHELARGLAAVRRGRSDHQLQRAEEAAQEREHQQQRLRHRHGPSLGR